MAVQALLELSSPLVNTAVLSFALLAFAYFYVFARPSLPKNAPPLSTESWPLIGAMQFFSQRWAFVERQMQHSHSGNFSFYAGDKPIIALSGNESRRIFFDSRQLGFSEGYAALLGGSPQVRKKNNPLAAAEAEDDDMANYFARRLTAMLKGPLLAKGLPQLLNDVRARIDELATKDKKTTDPFDSVYRMIFQVTMRTVACVEIANDSALLERVLQLYETIEGTATALSISYHWLPLPSKIRRTYNGAQLYMIFKNIIDARAKEGRREDDTLQYLIDQGDDVTRIITVSQVSCRVTLQELSG